jgi:hypothetical protein
MNVFTTALLFHYVTMDRALRKYGLEAHITMADQVLHVRGRNRYYAFYPLFMSFERGRLMFSAEIVPSTSGFVGWRPYFNKRWPIGSDKLAFKAFCAREGLPTPALWRAPSPAMRNFVVKHTGLSFGLGLRGPFKAYESANPAMQAEPEKGYYEAYVNGRNAKAWYWNDRLVCVELKSLPAVTGDGTRTLRQLIAAIVRATTPDDQWTLYQEMAVYQGRDLEAVPAKGQTVVVDFRFGSFADGITHGNQNKLLEMEDTPLVQQLRRFGPVLWRGIPEDLREAALYSVDAVLDDQDRIWLLEMNCNPGGHPDVYEPMLETLFGSPAAKTAAPIPAASALPTHPPFYAPQTPTLGPAAGITRQAPPAEPPALRRSRWLS